MGLRVKGVELRVYRDRRAPHTHHLVESLGLSVKVVHLGRSRRCRASIPCSSQTTMVIFHGLGEGICCPLIVFGVQGFGFRVWGLGLRDWDHQDGCQHDVGHHGLLYLGFRV